MSEEIKIIKAARPSTNAASRSKYPLGSLEPGTDDCFDAPENARPSIHGIARYHGMKIVTRDVGNGFIRVWRLT